MLKSVQKAGLLTHTVSHPTLLRRITLLAVGSARDPHKQLSNPAMSTTLRFRLSRPPNISSLTISDSQDPVPCPLEDSTFQRCLPTLRSLSRIPNNFHTLSILRHCQPRLCLIPFQVPCHCWGHFKFGYLSTNYNLNSPPGWWNLGPMGIVNNKRSWFRLSCSLYRYVMTISPFFLHLLDFKAWDIPKMVILLGICIRMSQTEIILQDTSRCSARRQARVSGRVDIISGYCSLERISWTLTQSHIITWVSLDNFCFLPMGFKTSKAPFPFFK